MTSKYAWKPSVWHLCFVLTDRHVKSQFLPVHHVFWWLCFPPTPRPPLPLFLTCWLTPAYPTGCVFWGRCPPGCSYLLHALAVPSPRPDQEHLQAETTACSFWNLLCLAHTPGHLQQGWSISSGVWLSVCISPGGERLSTLVEKTDKPQLRHLLVVWPRRRSLSFLGPVFLIYNVGIINKYSVI